MRDAHFGVGRVVAVCFKGPTVAVELDVSAVAGGDGGLDTADRSDEGIVVGFGSGGGEPSAQQGPEQPEGQAAKDGKQDELDLDGPAEGCSGRGAYGAHREAGQQKSGSKDFQKKESGGGNQPNGPGHNFDFRY